MVYTILNTESSPLLSEFTRIRANVIGVRHAHALFIFCGMMISYFLRINISAALVPMTNPNNGADYYDWDSSTKSLILSSFFWGYILMQVPAGILSRLYGAKIVYSLAMIVASILTALTPFAGKWGDWQVMCVFRAVLGFTQGVCYPCTHHLISQWAPISERSFLGTFIYSGAQLGSVLILAVSGLIFESSLHWPGIFYISAAFGLLWGVSFLIFGCENPAQSKIISKVEKEYIENQTGADSDNDVPKKVPWVSIVTSLPVWGLFAAQASFAWGYYTFLTNTPTYFNGALGLNVQSNALLSALPYLAMWICCLIISPISDWLINSQYLSRLAARKVFNTAGQWVPMLCLIGMGYLNATQSNLAIALLTIGIGMSAACYCGYLVNHMDLAPNFAGPIMGLTNGCSSICSLLAPLVVGFVVSDETNVAEWRIVFFITAAFYLVGNGLFLIFGKATIQSWNNISADNIKI